MPVPTDADSRVPAGRPSDPVWVRGHRMRLLDPAADRYVSPVLAARGELEPFETEWVLSLVRPGDTVLDLGAHVGYYTLLLARQVGPHGRVMAFEPDPTNFAALSENVALNGYRQVDLFNLAVGDRTGPVTLHRSPDNAGDHRVWAPAEPRVGVAARMAALDDLFGPHTPWVSLIKMDVQGAELAAARGMQRLLARQPHVAVAIEYWPYGLRGAGADPAQLLGLLVDLGFRFHRIDEGGRRLVRAEPAELLGLFPPPSDGFTNLLCVKA